MWKRVTFSILLAAGLGAACVPKTATVPTGGGVAKCKKVPGMVAEVRGVATVAGQPSQDLRLTLFNGFEPVSGTTAADGSYCLSLTESTDDTTVAVFATTRGMEPVAERAPVVLKQARDRMPVIQIKPIDLAKEADPDVANVIGLTYIRTTAGRPTVRAGIGSFEPDVGVRFDGAAGTALRSDASGLLLGSLPPGSYSLLTDRNVVVDGIRAEAGETVVLPIFSGEVINF